MNYEFGLKDRINITKITEIVIPGVQIITDVVAASSHSIFLVDNGKVFVCGNNISNQLAIDKYGVCINGAPDGIGVNQNLDYDNRHVNLSDDGSAGIELTELKCIFNAYVMA